MANYNDLIVFNKADDLAFQIYKATETFPKSEMFGLTSQSGGHLYLYLRI